VIITVFAWILGAGIVTTVIGAAGLLTYSIIKLVEVM
jgi:hypothetical protein